MQNTTPRTNLLINLFEEMKTKYIGMPKTYSYDIQNPNSPGSVSEPLTEKLIQHHVQRLNALFVCVYGQEYGFPEYVQEAREIERNKTMAASLGFDKQGFSVLDARMFEIVDIINLLFHPTTVTLSKVNDQLTYSINDVEYAKYRIPPQDVLTMRIHESPQYRCTFLSNPKFWFQCGFDFQDFDYMKIDKDLGIGSFEFWIKDLEINRKLHNTLTGLTPSDASLSGVLFSEKKKKKNNKPTTTTQNENNDSNSFSNNNLFMITTNKIIIGNTFLVIDQITQPKGSLLPRIKIRTIQLDRPVVHFSFIQLNKPYFSTLNSTQPQNKNNTEQVFLTPHSHLDTTYCIPLKTFYKFLDHFIGPIP